jgi:hypothetical protein
VERGARGGAAAPLEARGGFEVRLGPDGSFAGIRVLGTSAGDANAWNDAARRAARRLAAARVRLQPDESGGVIVRVEVESRNRSAPSARTRASSRCLGRRRRHGRPRRVRAAVERWMMALGAETADTVRARLGGS